MVSSFNIQNIRNWADINQGVWTSVQGTPMPTTPTGAYGPGWYSCGAIEASNGISEAVNVNETKIYLFQGGGLGRVLRSQFEHPFTVICAEENAVTLGLSRGNSVVTTGSGTSEVQTVTITGTGTAGTFSLILPGYGVASGLAYNASMAAVQTALQALLPTGYTLALPTGTAGSSYIVTFPSALGNMPQMSIVWTGITGATGASVATTTPGVNPINSTLVVPASQQNIRQFGMDFSDGVVHIRFLLSKAEAVQTGTVDRKADGISSVTLEISPYLDAANGGGFFTDLNDDPARAALLYV